MNPSKKKRKRQRLAEVDDDVDPFNNGDDGVLGFWAQSPSATAADPEAIDVHLENGSSQGGTETFSDAVVNDSDVSGPGAAKTQALGNEDYALFVDGVLADEVAFYQVSRSFFVVNGWNRKTRCSTVRNQ